MMKPKALVLASLAVGLLLTASLQGQGLQLRGQLWGGLTVGNDPAPGREYFEETVGYIPTLSLGRQFGPLSGVDLEFAYYINAMVDGLGEDTIESYDKLYRLWGRYATPSFELRLGLQKIAFGPGMVLRPLMWFDTLDPRDPTGQTEGVGALRLKWYPWPNLALWGWAIRPDHPDEASAGGRAEYTFGPGEVALTYHHRKATDLDYAGVSLFLPYVYEDRNEKRFAFDLRLDWTIGLWAETVLARDAEPAFDGDVDELARIMVGGDYTFPWGNGVYIMVEHLWSRLNYYELPPPDC